MSMQGIDCASYQAGIDPSVVPCDFVIVKSTQGTTYTNPDFYRLAEATLAAGKALGIYHYASGGNATDEANYMLDVASGYIGRAIFCLDWEGIQNDAFGSGRDSAWIDEFCSVIENRVGSECLVYLSKSVMGYAAGHKLWVAQYADMDSTGYQEHPWNEGAYDCTIRQYTSMGRLDGWGGDLDLDKAYMSRGEWDAWAAGNGAPASEPHKHNGKRDRRRKMECILTDINGANVWAYFDGHDIHDLTDPDDIKVLDMVYNACYGEDMPRVQLGSKDAPWASRLYQVVNAGAPVQIVPSLDDFEPRTPKD